MSDEESVGGSRDGDSLDTATGGGALSAEVLDMEEVFEALDHSRRRYLCYTLLEDTEWTLTDLATKIAALEDDLPAEEFSRNRVEAVEVDLYHTHVPKLADLNIITFDTETRQITASDNAEMVLAALNGLGGSLDSLMETHA